MMSMRILRHNVCMAVMTIAIADTKRGNVSGVMELIYTID